MLHVSVFPHLHFWTQLDAELGEGLVWPSASALAFLFKEVPFSQCSECSSAFLGAKEWYLTLLASAAFYLKPAEQGGCADCLLPGGVLSTSHFCTHTLWKEAKKLKHKLDCRGQSVGKWAEAVDLQRPVACEEITSVHLMQILYSSLKGLLLLLPFFGRLCFKTVSWLVVLLIWTFWVMTLQSGSCWA